MPKLTRPIKRTKRIPLILPSKSIAEQHYDSVRPLIEGMHADVMLLLGKYQVQFDANAEIAHDLSFVDALRKGLAELRHKWGKAFGGFARVEAQAFGITINADVTHKVVGAFKTIGANVVFGKSRANDRLVASIIKNNAKLIKSIDKKYFADVQKAILKNFKNGQDFHSLKDELINTFGKTERRAAFIARDQLHKSTEAIKRQRHFDLGFTREIWQHRGGTKKPRRTHIAMHNKSFDIKVGLYDSAVARYVLPGSEPNCTCTSIPDLSSRKDGIAMDSKRTIRGRIVSNTATISWGWAA